MSAARAGSGWFRISVASAPIAWPRHVTGRGAARAGPPATATPMAAAMVMKRRRSMRGMGLLLGLMGGLVAPAQYLLGRQFGIGRDRAAVPGGEGFRGLAG